MKRNMIFVAIVLSSLVLAATCATVTDAAAREVYNVGAGWTFFTAEAPSTDNSSIVNLPHIQTSAGTVNYLKDIDIPLSWADKRVFLRIGGAARVTDIFVNGTHTATHRGGNSAFTVEVTDRLRWGSPVSVRIVVGNAPSLDVLPIAGREKIYGGIFRSVELIVCEPLSISPVASMDSDGNPNNNPNNNPNGNPNSPGSSGTPGARSIEGGDGIWITTDRLTGEKAEGSVRLSLLMPDYLPHGALARVRFTDADGNLVAQNSQSIVVPSLTIPFTLSDPHLWQGLEDPYLYNVEVTLTTGEGIRTDSLSVPVGFRAVAIDAANNFTLNGRPMKLHGVILPRDRMMVGTALTPFQIEEDIDFILEMGANAVRVAGGQHSDYFYTLCDEAGLLVWNEGPFTGAAYPTDIDFVDTEPFLANGRQQLREMISQLYNHPSVVMWGLYSNVSVRTGNPVPYIRELNSIAHNLDSQRLTAASSVQDGEVNFITDLISFDMSLGWESGLPDGVVPWLEQLRTGWPDLRAGISYSAGASILHQSEQLERPLHTSNWHPEGWQTFFHEEYMRNAVDVPGLWGVFVGNMFDSGVAKVVDGAAASTPAGDGAGIDDRGLVTFDRKDRKDAFWLYKANWNTSEPFVRIAGSRLDTRSAHRQTIRIYSNLPEVELLIGGRSQGKRTGERGIFVWENVNLRTGVNRLEARATGVIEGGAVGSERGTGPATVTNRTSIIINPAAVTTSQSAVSTSQSVTSATTATPAAVSGLEPTAIGATGAAGL